MKIPLLLLASILCFQTSWANIFLEDSLKKVRKNNKTYILHQIDSGETIASIAKRYKVEISQILAENPHIKNARVRNSFLFVVASMPKYQTYRVKKGETLEGLAKKFSTTKEKLIELNNIQNPNIIKEKSVIKVAVNTETMTKLPAWVYTPIVEMPLYHRVRAEETIFKISRYYGVKLDSIKIWNALTSNKILKGDSLIVGFAKDSLGIRQFLEKKKKIQQEDENTTILADTSAVVTNDSIPVDTKTIVARKIKISQTTDSEVKKVEKDSIRIPSENKLQEPTDQLAEQRSSRHEVEAHGEAKNEPTVASDTVVKVEAIREGIVRERGIIVVLSDKDDIQKPVAWHRIAPIGSFLLVTNPKNAKQVAVRVVGKLESSENNAILKISKVASSMIGISENTAEVVIEYKIQ